MTPAREPAVSVAICLFNSSRFIDETLESVFAQTFGDYEVVLVDDGSTDGCADRIERHHAGRRLRIVRQSHQGLSIARRVSIAAASAPYVAFLDHDDIWMPDKLERQMAAARANPAAALLFSDCVYVDEGGRPLRRLSEHYALDGIDLSGTRAYAELLRRGCFVWQSTVVARRDALVAAGAFDPAYPYIADYDTWLRLARRHPLHYTPAVLAKWRVHPNQFTNRCPDVTLDDHRRLLGPLFDTASTPAPIRIALGDRLLGQHRVSCRMLIHQKRFRLAARAALGMADYPDRLRAFVLGSLAQVPVIGRPVAGTYRTVRRALRAPRRLLRTISPPSTRPEIWIDGSALAVAQTGYFNLTAELIRSLAGRDCAVHVVTPPEGRRALVARLGGDGARVGIHRDAPRRQPSSIRLIEVVIWRGRFRWRESHRIAIVQDLTTRIVPELHTPGNVVEFEQYLEYVRRHAQTIATVSEHSRRDIIERVPVFPDSVSVIPMPVHPCYRRPAIDRAFVELHGLTTPYVLSVGCIEPRKNLRRLLRAFELLIGEDAVAEHSLVFAGTEGWDEGFARAVSESDARTRVRRLGFVPTEHLPLLYHFASAVVYPSLYEGFGLPVLEAMCASGVVLASNTSSLPEVLGDAGIQFDPHRTEAVAAALLEALALTPAEALEHRRRCRARADALLDRAARLPVLPGLDVDRAAVHSHR